MDIYRFQDYRRFMRHFIETQPKKGRGEINRMAQAMGVHPSLLSQVLGEAKNLSLEQTQLLSEHLGLTDQETEYLFHLVQWQRAGTEKLRNYFKAKALELKNKSLELSQRVRQDRQLNEEEKSVFYSHWLYAGIWLLTSIGRGKSLSEIAESFEVTRERADEVLRFLVDTQLCIAKDGRYVMGPQSVHLPRGSAHLHKHHTNWRLRAIAASDQIEDQELMYTAPISVSQADFQKIRSRLAELIKEITDVAIQSEAEEIICFNIDLFKIKK